MFIYIYNKALRSYIYIRMGVYMYVYMSAIDGQTTGPNELTFF